MLRRGIHSNSILTNMANQKRLLNPLGIGEKTQDLGLLSGRTYHSFANTNMFLALE